MSLFNYVLGFESLPDRYKINEQKDIEKYIENQHKLMGVGNFTKTRFEQFVEDEKDRRRYCANGYGSFFRINIEKL